MKMKYFRKKPVVIEAVQITDELFDSALKLQQQPSHELVFVFDEPRCVRINTLEGTMTGQMGDWIIRGINGELYPCKPEIFQKTYEAVE